MIDVKIVKKAKGTATASSGSGGSSSVTVTQQGTVNDARHAKQADEAAIAQRAHNADNADRAAYADRAGIADRATSLSPDSPEFDKFLRKDIDDEAAGNVTFDQTIDVKGNTTLEGDLDARGSVTFDQTIDVKGNTTLEGDLDARGSVTHGGTTVHQGQTTHNALARFNQDAEIPADSTERVMGTIKFMAPLSDGADVTPQERGYINGNGNAQLQTLDVKGRADLEGVAHIHELISEAVTGQAEDFIDGYDGHGLRIWKEEDPVSENKYKWHITADYLTIRQQMKVFELLIQKIRSTGGTIVVSNANGKVKSVSKSVDNTWRLTFETGCDFAVGDIIRCQSWKNMREQGSHVETSAWTGKVYAVQGTGEDAVVIIPDTAEWFSGSTPKGGDECVQWGSTDTARQNIIYITAAEGDNPAVDMLGEVTGPGTGNLHVRIGKLDGIVPGSNVLVPQGWGLYADNAFLKGKFVLENGKDVYQLFIAADGRLESTISETRALTTGDSIIANPAFLDGFQPWNYYHVTSQSLSDGVVILSDGEKLLSGVGDATKYVGLVTEGMRRFVRIVDNESTDPDIGIEQDVTFMRQVDGKKTVELSFEYRIHTSGDVLITIDSYKDGLVGSLSTEKTSDLYGLQSALVKDGEWHTARVYGTYVSGNGSIQVCAKGNVDLSAFQLYEAVGVQSLSTSITQTSEQIALQAERITQQGNQIVRMNSSINEQAGQIALQAEQITQQGNQIVRVNSSINEQAGQIALQAEQITQQGNQIVRVNSSINEQAGQIALQAERITEVEGNVEGHEAMIESMNSEIQVNASGISALTTRVTTDEGRIGSLEQAGFVSESDYASVFASKFNEGISTTIEGTFATQSALTSAQNQINQNLSQNYYDKDAVDSEISGATTGMLTTSNVGTIFSGSFEKDPVTGKWDYNITAQISVYNFIDHDAVFESGSDTQIKGGILLSADMITQVAQNISLTADRIDFRGFTDINGFTVDTSGNLTIDGVVNNNLMVITSANVYDRFSHYGNQTWLDPSMLGSIVKLDSSLAQLTIQLPWMNYDSGEGYKQGTDAKLTLDEMRRCIGKKFVIYSEGIGHNFQCGTQDDGWLISEGDNIFSDLDRFPMDSATAQTKSFTRQYNTGIKAGHWIELEFCLGNYKDYECFYWKMRYVDCSMLPDDIID